RKGARVVLACRNRTKADAAIADIHSDVVYMHLDLASFKSIRCFTETFLKAESRLDLLINNAGLVADGRTEDGFGIEFGVNHLGHFLLTRLLLERLKEAGGGRVITLSNSVTPSQFHVFPFWQAYCNSKLCNNLFTHELAKRLRGTDVTCYSVHPGVVRTELSRYVGLWQKLIIEPIARLLFLEPEAGAQTTLHCALQEGIEHLSGSYFSFCAVQEVCARARDDAVARKLWEVSERLCGLS
uniref:Dehydrogenase/reductase SDR family member 13-like n=1 Tax=Scophthalmus maximus TaxID=52904 RepID=A0A8D3D4K4_SCOMX